METLTLTEHKATTEFLCIAPIKNDFVPQIKAFYEDLRSRGRVVSIKTLRVKFGQLMPSCQLLADYDSPSIPALLSGGWRKELLAEEDKDRRERDWERLAT